MPPEGGPKNFFFAADCAASRNDMETQSPYNLLQNVPIQPCVTKTAPPSKGGRINGIRPSGNFRKWS